MVTTLQSDVHVALTAALRALPTDAGASGIAEVGGDAMAGEGAASPRSAASDSRFERVSIPKSLMGAAQQAAEEEEAEEHEL